MSGNSRKEWNDCEIKSKIFWYWFQPEIYSHTTSRARHVRKEYLEEFTKNPNNPIIKEVTFNQTQNQRNPQPLKSYEIAIVFKDELDAFYDFDQFQDSEKSLGLTKIGSYPLTENGLFDS